MHMKPRRPGSFARAIVEAIDMVGAQAIADACEVSTSYVHQWAQDDNPRLPNVRQAYDLDAFMKVEKGYTPLFGVTAHRLARINAPRATMSLDDAMLEAVTGLGHLAESIKEAKAPTGRGGHRMTNCEKSEIADKVSLLERKIDQIKASLDVQEVIRFPGAAE